MHKCSACGKPIGNKGTEFHRQFDFCPDPKVGKTEHYRLCQSCTTPLVNFMFNQMNEQLGMSPRMVLDKYKYAQSLKAA